MNSVILIGRLTKDVELRFVPGSGTAVAHFTIAIDKNLSKDKKKQTEAQGKPTADFIRIVVWGKRAETCANFLAKGRLVAVNGSITTSTYKSQSGEMRYSTDVIANNVEFLEWGSNLANPSKDDFITLDKDLIDGFKALENDDDIPF